MTTIAPPICYRCIAKHPGLTCDAFPEGIPHDILMSEAGHRQPFVGDKGMRFEPKREKDAAYAKSLFAPWPPPEHKPRPS